LHLGQYASTSDPTSSTSSSNMKSIGGAPLEFGH
jgi:hypothetical protein